MDVIVRYHALLRERTGRAEEPCALPAGATVAAVLARFAGRYPTLAGLGPSLRAAVNDEFAAPDALLRDGDIVDLLPPFGGG